MSSTPRLFPAPLRATSLLSGRRSPSLPSPAPDNPLPACPDAPNCERVSQEYDVPAPRLFGAAQAALDALNPIELRLAPDAGRASAVYRVALVFKDDVDAAVEDRNGESVLHLRSASRIGYSDLGVNRRRVAGLLRAVDEHL